MNYFSHTPDEREREEFEQVLLEQMDLQHWFSVVVIAAWHVEILIPLH